MSVLIKLRNINVTTQFHTNKCLHTKIGLFT